MAQPQGPPVEFVWMFEVKENVWQPVSLPDNQAMEGAYAQNPAGSATVQLYGAGREAISYLLNFATSERINVATQSKRRMRRVHVSELSTMEGLLPPPQPAAPADHKAPVRWALTPKQEGAPGVNLTAEDAERAEQAYQAGAPAIDLRLGEVAVQVDFNQFAAVDSRGTPWGVVRIDPYCLPPVLPAEQGVFWFYRDDGKMWHVFANEDGKVIENQWKSGQSGSVVLRDIPYFLDFSRWVRVNEQSHSERPIRRVVDGRMDPQV